MAYALTTSPRCRQTFWAEGWFQERARELGLPPLLHRKFFELILVAQVYTERIGFGGMACGFGVGIEPLPAWLAAQGCHVLVTNLDTDAPEARAWQASGQHVGAIAALPYVGITSQDVVQAQCDWRMVDMRAIPEDLGHFDLIWSTCSLEHLGSRQQGQEFLVQAAQHLTPGGWAVHTTELQVSTDQSPLDHAGTVTYLPEDLAQVATQLRDVGVTLLPLDLAPGTLPEDAYVDGPPYTGHVQGKSHLQLSFGGRVCTSVALIMQREA
jgi:hypothetical protein